MNCWKTYPQADSKSTGKLIKMRRGQNTSLDRTLTTDQSKASEGSIAPSCRLRGTRQGKISKFKDQSIPR